MKSFIHGSKCVAWRLSSLFRCLPCKPSLLRLSSPPFQTRDFHKEVNYKSALIWFKEDDTALESFIHSVVTPRKSVHPWKLLVQLAEEAGLAALLQHSDFLWPPHTVLVVKSMERLLVWGRTFPRGHPTSQPRDHSCLAHTLQNGSMSK